LRCVEPFSPRCARIDKYQRAKEDQQSGSEKVKTLVGTGLFDFGAWGFCERVSAVNARRGRTGREQHIEGYK
jgi:hypothetical protein